MKNFSILEPQIEKHYPYKKQKFLIRSNSFDIILFYILRTIENNRKTIKAIEILSFFNLHIFGTSLSRIFEYSKPISIPKKILQTFQFSTNSIRI